MISSFCQILRIGVLIFIIISTNGVNSLLLPVFATTTTTTDTTTTNNVRPVWFSSKYYTTTEKPVSLRRRKIEIPNLVEEEQRKQQREEEEEDDDDSSTPRESCVIFIHGRLEAEFGKVPFPRPAELYSEFCYGLANRCPEGNSTVLGNENSLKVFLIEYDELLSRKLKKEPRDFRYGPISSALFETIQSEILTHYSNNNDADIIDPKPKQLVLVTFSMGAAMAMKLLYNSNELQKAVTHVIFIEPVFRCWLPFAVMNPQHIMKDTTIEILALYGTNDQLTRDDSGKSVLGSLRQFIPNINVVPIQGGNHWGILTENVAGSIAWDGLDNDQDDVDIDEKILQTITPQSLQREMIDHIAAFCGWD